MTLPSGPFVCKNIDVEAAVEAFDRLAESWYHGDETSWWLVEGVVAAALGEVIPAEVEERLRFYDADTPSGMALRREQRYRTTWQPAVSDKEQP
jgi:hypothetical protein